MQPWKVRLEADNSMTVFCDLDRLLPATDPPNRQITIGFGCFLELFRQAAAEKGIYARIEPFPEGEPFPNLDERPIARVTFPVGARVAKDPLFGAVLTRRTNRVPFDDRTVENAVLENIMQATVPGIDVGSTNEAGKVQTLRDLAVASWEVEWGDPAARRESIDVTRIGKKEINANPWGLSLAGPLMEGLNKVGKLTRPDMDIAGTLSYDETLKFYNGACETAQAFIWSVTETNTRKDQLEAGRAWVRLQLAANAKGVSFHPLSQALQEFPSMAAHYEQMHKMLAGGEGRTVQMLTRLGYAKAPAPPAPRESMTSKLIGD
jgi:hypothetical protein